MQLKYRPRAKVLWSTFNLEYKTCESLGLITCVGQKKIMKKKKVHNFQRVNACSLYLNVATEIICCVYMFLLYAVFSNIVT